MNKLLVCISLGDPSGIGPEVIFKSLQKQPSSIYSQILVVGELWIFQNLCKELKINLPFTESDKPLNNHIAVKSLNLIKPEQHTFGTANALSGNCSFLYFEKCITLCQTEQFQGLVTGPICKESLHLAKHKYMGHTDILERYTKQEAIMTILHPKVSVSHVTDHLPLRKAIDAITPQRITRVCEALYKCLKNQNISNPKIAIAGVNPHAGESGILGSEEQDILIPTLKNLKHIPVKGPFSADTIFYRAFQGEFNGIIAMYHDQGFTPMKTIDFKHGVNCTLGLPFIRTSPNHGTAFNLAGLNQADETSMSEAIRWAFQLCGQIL